ncbi:hypothetical protein AXF42_Ash005146 [Apostasia shenzhenica]|uniref:Origin recognition complex subunit 3 N-terminal domain-containing protein n=1 Tax=Apostasia shenzhenica TaxID=1088818 RepID=A0A2I0B8K0_9ASPA|nr:hypothetical protein AXF42_Ash005146 [Apostasia shenzhenica]
MALSSSFTSDPASLPVADTPVLQVDDNNLQPFFILHRAATCKSGGQCSSEAGRRRGKINRSLRSPSEDRHDFEKLRLHAFHLTWSRMDSTIKDVLKDVNLNLFDEIFRWIREAFSTIGCSSPLEVTKPYPITADATYKRIPTALVFTRNAEFVDDLLTFQDLKGHLSSNGCHVVNLSALDFSIKQGVGSCLRSLSRQLSSVASDAADVHTIASWYCKPANFGTPIVVIIEELERCDGAVLADFIRLLSEWVMKIPVILIIGVATASDAATKIFPTSVLHILQPYTFTLCSTQQKMDSLIEGVLVRLCSGFFIGHNVAVFLKNYFRKYDGTVTAFLKALKASFSSKYETLTDVLQRYASDFPSCQRGGTFRSFGDNLKQVFSELNRLQSSWSSVVMVDL